MLPSTQNKRSRHSDDSQSGITLVNPLGEFEEYEAFSVMDEALYLHLQDWITQPVHMSKKVREAEYKILIQQLQKTNKQHDRKIEEVLR